MAKQQSYGFLFDTLPGSAVGDALGQIAAAVNAGVVTLNLVVTNGETTLNLVVSDGLSDISDALADALSTIAGTPGSTIYASTAAGLAGTTNGQYFLVVGTGNVVATVYLNSAGTAVAQEAYPSYDYIAGLVAQVSSGEAEWVSRDAMRLRMKHQFDDRPLAAIVITPISQSNGTWRSGTQVSGTAPANCFMLNGGAYAQQYAFAGTNVTYPMRYVDCSTSIQFAEPAAGQGPLAGLAHALAGKFSRVYLFSPAIGARTIAVLTKDGPLANVDGGLKYLCEHAIANGFRPVVLFYVAEGEADATAATGEATIYSTGLAGYRHMRELAVNASGIPGLRVPMTFKQMAQMSNAGTLDREAIMAFNRIADDIADGMVLVSHDTDHTSDRVHASSTGYFQQGFKGGNMLAECWFSGTRVQALRVTSVKQVTTTTFRVYWSHEAEQHTTSNPTFITGENLDANYLKGIGWEDNGTLIDVLSVVDEGATSLFTLSSPIAGTIGQQWLLCGMQRTTGTLTSGADYRAGGLYRKTARAAGKEMYGQPLQALTTFDHRAWFRAERIRPIAA